MSTGNGAVPPDGNQPTALREWGYSRGWRLFTVIILWPRKTVRMAAGPAVDLSAYAGQCLSASALGAQVQTFAGLAGMGDLVATCLSPLSRNRTFGENLGRGMSVAEAAALSQTAKGVASCEPALEPAGSHGVEMPITEVAAAVMRDGLPVEQATSMLASRSAKPEWYGP